MGFLAVAGLTALYAYERDIQGQFLNYERSKSELSELREEVDRRKQEEAQARRRVEMLRTDPVEREATVRRNKNLLRAGERIFRIEPEAAEAKPAASAEPLPENEAIGQSEALTAGERN
jgi:hypothetical protein